MPLAPGKLSTESPGVLPLPSDSRQHPKTPLQLGLRLILEAEHQPALCTHVDLNPALIQR